MQATAHFAECEKKSFTETLLTVLRGSVLPAIPGRRERAVSESPVVKAPQDTKMRPNARGQSGGLSADRSLQLADSVYMKITPSTVLVDAPAHGQNSRSRQCHSGGERRAAGGKSEGPTFDGLARKR